LTPPHRASRRQWRSAPEGEALRRENERLRGEVEQLRRQMTKQSEQIAEKEKQIADAEKQIADSLSTEIEQAQTIGTVQRHQVTELPPIQAQIIEYQCHRVVCPECGESTRAGVPEEATGQFGPQLTALVAYLTMVCRMPRRVVETLLEQVLGIEISLGSTQKCWEARLRVRSGRPAKR
jgi:hypothetical protein